MLGRVPLLALALGLLAVAMAIPTISAAIESDWRSGRTFLYCGIITGLGAILLGVLLRPLRAAESVQDELAIIVATWLILPVFAALPVFYLLPVLGHSGALFEMVAALTTTGGTAIPRGTEVPDAVHLWRGLCGWIGGFITLLGVWVVLAPRRLGGFEVSGSVTGSLLRGQSVALGAATAPLDMRLRRAVRAILPVYLVLTAVAGFLLSGLGQGGLAAAVHAMGIVSTSGITPLSGGFAEQGGFAVEAVTLILLGLVATRAVYGNAMQPDKVRPWQDPELRLLVALALGAAAVLFVRHWVGALTIAASEMPVGGIAGADALWGGFFTAVSFATTTGYESASWETARDWSGLSNPGLILLALAAIGGGAATTAGGIKLIRAHALAQHGIRELTRIAQPFSIASADASLRGLRREGAFIAWAFMMLFLIALFGAVLALTAAGLGFDRALIAAVAALANIGPIYALVAERPAGFAEFGPVVKGILGVVMILGRIEILALIALFNPGGWSRVSRRTKKTGNVGANASR